ncbi:heterokaryon incompatibility protein 6, OR allele [Podospora conica]|nr:heterokaryon incompatibility protein 6, OR allele [Schizothecium conicum]
MSRLLLDFAWGAMREGMIDGSGPGDVRPDNVLYSSLPSTPSGVRGAPFRLLHLLPGTGLAPLQCLLEESLLDKQPDRYEALSYVWGNLNRRVPVKVDGAMLRIGENLCRALLALRLPEAPRIIWVDAMCINQEDNDERANQVAIMRDIYRNASQTVVWFGDSTKGTKTAFAYMQRLFDEAQDWEKYPDKRLPPRTGPTFKLLSGTTTLGEFTRNEWWVRIWTAQEILLAKRATIVYGEHHIPWDVFLKAKAHGSALGVWDFPILGAPEISTFHMVDNTLALKERPGFPTPADELLFFLFRARNREATDPQDKIFALLGLISGDVRALEIQADYRASAEDVFRHATKRLLENSRNLDVLGLCYPYKTRTVRTLPSWVPDWGSTAFVAYPMMEDSKRNPRSTHASKHHSAQVNWEDGNDALIIDGHSQGTIAHLSRVRPEINDDEMWDGEEVTVTDDAPFRQTLSELKAALGMLWDNVAMMIGPLAIYLEWEEFVMQQNPTNPGQGAGDAMLIYCLTLCTGTLAPGGISETYQMFKTWMEKFAPIRKLRRWKLDEGKKTYRLLSLIGYIKSTWSDYGEFVNYTIHTEERRLGTTSNGYLALLPKLTEIGDELVILKGGRVPVVLRPRDDGSMQFIGEAYVQGIMDGEAFREQDCVKLRIR